MKTTAILFFAVAVIFSSCSKENRSMNTYYYTSSTEGSALTLFIDGENKGQLPVISEKADPKSATQKTTALYIPVPSGTHKIEARKGDGSVVSFNKMTFSSNKMGCTATKGGSSVASDNESIMVELY